MEILSGDKARNVAAIDALVNGTNADPFAVLGMHPVEGGRIVRAFRPGANRAELVRADGSLLAEMHMVHPDGFFSGLMPARKRRYLLRFIFADGHEQTLEDPYRFGSLISGGNDAATHEQLGAQVISHHGVIGTCFAVWAPNARRVSVVGEWNAWDGRVHVMRRHADSGCWEIFVPQVLDDAAYKFELLDRDGRLLPLKSDPYAQRAEPSPGTASIVFRSNYRWGDEDWMRRRPQQTELDRPVSIYEVHLGSWRRKAVHGDSRYTYRELADELVNYVQELAFTHVELMPVSEHPFDGSWGYQPIGLYAATSRFGSPDDLRYLVDRCHQAGIGVILDWVAAHFPRDDHGLRRFDGTALYEHEDPRRAEHIDWGTLNFDYGRREVVDYLIGNARFWVEQMHIDSLRVDAVASMIYLDYSRKGADWLPNEEGGNQNHDAVRFLQRMNEVLHACGGTTFAEESTTWPGVTKPVYAGGLGFTYKWNLGWMHDTLGYMQEDPLFRKYHHDKMTFGLVYAFEENFVLPLSHDEVVHGKGSLLGRMPGDDWQQFAGLRAYFGFQYCHPGKKLMFMGGEFGQRIEWNHEQSLDWHLLDEPLHAGLRRLVRDLNRVYRDTAALYEIDFERKGFTWLIADDRDHSTFAWLRHAGDGSSVVCVANFTPLVREDFEIPVSGQLAYHELLNTDKECYGGSGVHNPGTLHCVKKDASSHVIRITLPPLAMVMLRPATNLSQ